LTTLQSRRQLTVDEALALVDALGCEPGGGSQASREAYFPCYPAEESPAPMKQARVLVVDDDPEAGDSYNAAIGAIEGCEVVFETDAAAALRRVEQESFDVLVAAIHPPTLDGVELLRRARSFDPALPAVLVAATPTVESATEALRLGAGDYLTKPLEREALAASVGRLILQRRLGAEHELLRRQIERPYSFDDIIGICPAMRKVFETIERVADSGVDVLVVGDTGTGKELVARSIHRRSRRASKPFVPVDCGAIPENLLESEFFGHERGAFTGADSRTIGLLEFADGGTFFLDELGELPLLLQAKLLRTLQERKIRRVGGRTEIGVDVRIVAATARNLSQLVEQQKFRRDLYYRINVVTIQLPPLRERGDDLGLLAEHFVAKYSREMGRTLAGITPEAYQVLSHYHWPGNVRELQNVMRRAIALSTDRMIGLDDLPDALVTSAGQSEPTGRVGYFELRDDHLAKFERQYLHELLSRHEGDVKTAAEEAQVPRGTLYRLMKNQGIDGSQFR
jgi:two-component system response regulator HydG